MRAFLPFSFSFPERFLALGGRDWFNEEASIEGDALEPGQVTETREKYPSILTPTELGVSWDCNDMSISTGRLPVSVCQTNLPPCKPTGGLIPREQFFPCPVPNTDGRRELTCDDSSLELNDRMLVVSIFLEFSLETPNVYRIGCLPPHLSRSTVTAAPTNSLE
jgi:hypothetical protein